MNRYCAGCRAVWCQRNNGQSHGRVWNMVGIQIKSLNLALGRDGKFLQNFAPNDICADFFPFTRKGNVALNAVCADTGYADDRTRQSGLRPRNKMRWRHRLPHINARGAWIFGTGRDFKYTVVFIDDVHTELRHQFERDVDIRLGNQLAYHVDFKCLSGQGQSSISRAVRNWLETLPLIGITRSPLSWRLPI